MQETKKVQSDSFAGIDCSHLPFRITERMRGNLGQISKCRKQKSTKRELCRFGLSILTIF